MREVLDGLGSESGVRLPEYRDDGAFVRGPDPVSDGGGECPPFGVGYCFIRGRTAKRLSDLFDRVEVETVAGGQVAVEHVVPPPKLTFDRYFIKI
ncbi:MAG: hypothetical protein LLG14_14210 [Nocardiaceae bacterium]|nr:hypothetical protein [Nocardiaceae bacterium]